MSNDMMSSYVSLELLCDSILNLNKSIQSVAIINNRGRVIEKISRFKFSKHFPNHLNELFCMSCVLQVSMGRDFDENYGPTNYYISERTNLTMITFPLDENVILATLDKRVSPITLCSRIIHMISDHKKMLNQK
jgi:hypothetical protein